MKKFTIFLLVFKLIIATTSTALALDTETTYAASVTEEILPAYQPTLTASIMVYQPDAQGNMDDVPNATVIIYQNGREIHRLLYPNHFGGFIFFATTGGTFDFRAEAPGFTFVPGPFNSVVWDGRSSIVELIDLEMRPVGAGTLPFRDVAPTAWYRGAVQFVYDNGIMTGTTTTTFSPRTNFSRAMTTATLFRIQNGRPANASDPRDNPFTDVAANRWYAPYITWAFREGLVTGVTDTRFSPGVPISRQDFATVLWRYALVFDLNIYAESGTFDRFPDAAQTGSWARPGLNWAVYHGLITGIDGNLVPRGLANRAQTATILERFITTFYD